MSKIMYKDKQILGCVSDAQYVAFNNADTGLSATNVQNAIAEVNGKLNTKQDKNNYTILAPYSHAGTCYVEYHLPETWRTLIVFTPNSCEVGRVNKTGEIDSFLNIAVSYSDGVFHFSGMKYYTNICIIFTW